MDHVFVAPEAEGLGGMLADLIRANLEAHPNRIALLQGVRGSVSITAVDAGVGAGLRFTGSTLEVGSTLPAADLSIECDAETLMSLSSVPLRFGRPDPMTPQGREVFKKIFRRSLKIRGMLTHPKLLTRLNKLLTVV